METELRERIVVDGAEAAASKLGVLATAANRIGHAFAGLGEIASVAGGIAGLWKVAESVQEVDHLYKAVMRVQDITGVAAENAHAMFDMFELSGIEMESAERIITSMTRKGAQLADGFGGAGAHAQMLNATMAQLGVTIKSGPEDRLFAMAKAAKAGQVDINQLIQAFGIPRGQAAQMMSMLKQGPEKLRAIQKDTMSGADVIDNATLESYRNMLQVRRELGDAWGDLIGVLYKNLIPAITEVLREIKKGFDDIAPVAASIGKLLKDHMTAVVALAKTYLAISIANRAINMVTGGDSGAFGKGRSAVGGILGFFQKKRAANVAMDYFEAKAANPGAGMFSAGGAGTMGTIMSLVRGIGPWLARLGPALAAFVPAIAAAAPVILAIAAAVAVAVVAFELFKRNVWGIGDALRKSFGEIWGHLKHIVGKLIDVLLILWNALKPILAVVGFILLASLEQLAWWIGKLAWVIEKVIDIAMASPGMQLLKAFGDLFADKKEVEKNVDDEKRGSGKAPGTNMDFRGSKFEITNNFPPGIDGGRVAVAFSDELAALGERRLDSGVRPLFSFR